MPERVLAPPRSAAQPPVGGVVRAAVLVASAAAFLAACGSPSQQQPQGGTGGSNGQVGNVLLRDVYIESPPAIGYPSGSDATVRLTLVNRAGQPDSLTRVTSDVATRADIRSDGDCAGAAETLPSLALPAGLDLSSPQNGPRYVIRLVNLRIGLAQGGSVPITFTFRNAGSITLPTPVDGVAAGRRPGTAAPTSCATAGRS